RERDARREAADGLQVPGAAALHAELLVVLERQPDLRVVREAEAFGCDADDGAGLAVDLDRASQHARVAAEAIAPQLVAEHRDLRLAGLVLVGHESAAERRPNAQHV